jgi:hypothetical protein
MCSDKSNGQSKVLPIFVQLVIKLTERRKDRNPWEVERKSASLVVDKNCRLSDARNRCELSPNV